LHPPYTPGRLHSLPACVAGGCLPGVDRGHSCQKYGRQNLTRDGKPLRLFPGRGLVLATIKPDLTWPGLWRVHLPNGYLTDKVNLSRATDAAASLALAVLNRHREAA
jgi:hypothetical protein